MTQDSSSPLREVTHAAAKVEGIVRLMETKLATLNEGIAANCSQMANLVKAFIAWAPTGEKSEYWSSTRDVLRHGVFHFTSDSDSSSPTMRIAVVLLKGKPPRPGVVFRSDEERREHFLYPALSSDGEVEDLYTKGNRNFITCVCDWYGKAIIATILTHAKSTDPPDREPGAAVRGPTSQKLPELGSSTRWRKITVRGPTSGNLPEPS